MKKVLAILICTLTLNAHATEMCARDDTVVVPLDATIEPTGTAYSNNTEMIFAKRFSYGNLVFASGCFSVNEVRNIQNDPNITANTLPYELLTTNEMYTANNGWYNGDENDPENARNYCYHQLTHPMLSRWWAVYNERGFATPKQCMDACMNKGVGNIMSTVARRRDLFDSIGL